MIKNKITTVITVASLALMFSGANLLATPITAFGATETQNHAPVISPAATKFLVEKNQKFDLASALSLSVIDDTDGDLTKQTNDKIPAIDTSSVGKQEIKIQAIDHAGLASSITVTINVIEVVESAQFDRFDSVNNCSPASYVNGNKSDLSITLGSTYPEKSVFQIIITDGSNRMEKLITATDYQGIPFSSADGKIWYQGQWIPADKWSVRDAYIASQNGADVPITTDGTGGPTDGTNYTTDTSGEGPYSIDDTTVVTGDSETAPGEEGTETPDGTQTYISKKNGSLPSTGDIAAPALAAGGVLTVLFAVLGFFFYRKKKQV